MIQKLPYRNLKWDDKITEDDIINYNNGRTGCILEVNLEYPKEPHNLHHDYPLAPEVMNVKANMLSDKQEETYKLINGCKEPKDEKTEKLILSLNDKNKYVVHIGTTETSPKKDRDKTETRPRHHRDITETRPRHPE